MSATYWRVQHCPARPFFRWRVVDMTGIAEPIHIETFMTRRGAERFIRRHTWRSVQ